MKSAVAKSTVSSINTDPDETGLSIILGRFELCPFGTVIDTKTGANLGRIQYMRADSLSQIVQSARAEWLRWMVAGPAQRRRAA